MLQAVVEQYLNIGGLSLKEKGLKVRISIASGSGRTVPEHRGLPPQGGRSEVKNKHCFRQCVEQYLNIEGLGLKEDGLKVRTIFASGSQW